MSAAFALALRRWPALLAIAGFAALSILLAVRTDQRDEARAALARERDAFALFRAEARAAAEAQARRFGEVARRTEQAQQQVTQEVSRDYQERIADLRRRIRTDPAGRLRRAAAAADPGGGGGAAILPSLSGAAGRPDGAAGADRLPLAEALIATEQAIRLDELQRWVRRQQAVAPAEAVAPADTGAGTDIDGGEGVLALFPPGRGRAEIARPTGLSWARDGAEGSEGVDQPGVGPARPALARKAGSP